MADQCLFCRIVRREIPATILAETERCIAFRDINPQAPTHLLVIPKAHITSLNDLSDPEMGGELLLLASRLAREEGVAESGFRTVINTNAEGGQQVYHIHLHVLGGRQLTWPPG